MVTFANETKLAGKYSNPMNRRKHKRVLLKLNLFIRRLFNSNMYVKVVQTVDISAKGLQVICDVNLEVGAELEISNLKRDVIVVGVVKHSSRDLITGKWLLGLAITEKKTDWFVTQALEPTRSFSLSRELIN
jgi:hypothetical protein